MNKQRTWKAFDNIRNGYLGYATGLIDRALKIQAEPYFNIKSLQERPELNTEPMFTAFKTLYSKVGINFANYTFNQLKSDHSSYIVKDAFDTPKDWDKVVDNWIRTGGEELLQNLNKNTRKGIEDLLRKALLEGQSLGDFKRALSKKYTISSMRANVIARTEIVRASNFGSQLGAESVGIAMRKEWVSVLVGSRPDHIDAHGQKTEGLKDDFIVGGEACSYPLDPRLSAAQSVQCRCVVSYIPYRE